MKTDKLLEILNLNHVKDSSEPLDVSIIIDKPSFGPTEICKVDGISCGFDWDYGKLLIHPAIPLVPKTDKENIYDMAWELLLWIATKPVKRETYEVRMARKMFECMKFDYMKHQKFLHQEIK